jgi:hypothetical protein
MKNLHRSAVAQDIQDAILKTHANSKSGATYWSQSEQQTRLVAAYEKWSTRGGVWATGVREVRFLQMPIRDLVQLTSSTQTHLNQLMHVTKGCLARTHQDFRSDGSRIEGSHKGWNSLQRTFACGIELITALAHDFVLCRNCQVGSERLRRTPFMIVTHGSHHVHLVNATSCTWNLLLAKENS